MVTHHGDERWNRPTGFDGILGTRFRRALILFPVLLALQGFMAWRGGSWPMWAGFAAALVGWGWAVAIVVSRHRAARPGHPTDRTPWGPLIIPIVLMVAGFLVPWRWLGSM